VTALDVEVAGSEAEVAPALARWDELAIACARPYCAPGWAMAWWRNAAPEGSVLRVVLVSEGGELVGVAPMFAERAGGGWHYRMLTAPICSRTAPLALPGRETEVAEAICRGLAAADPRPAVLRLEGVEQGSDWPALLTEGWPGRGAVLLDDFTNVAPTLGLTGHDFEAWFASKSSNFRSNMRRNRRQIDKAGARSYASSRPDLERDLAEFMRLHHARMDPKGGSDALLPGVGRMLAEAGADLEPKGRFRLWTIEVEDAVISAHLFVEAGGELVYWLGGIDDDWANRRPGLLAILAAIEDGMGRGEARLDLGPGDWSYKYRFSDGEDVLEWKTLVPRGPAYSRVRLRRLPKRLRRLASGALRSARRNLVATPPSAPSPIAALVTSLRSRG
jgi:CelD/BcsL family acetyltransferase involved in cellulose biosynthesis